MRDCGDSSSYHCHSSRRMLAFCNDEKRRRELPLNVVELWFAKLAPLNFSVQPFLSDVEIKRALSFRSDRDAARFITRHGILRLILAAYTGVSPSALSFTCSQLGKPALDGFCQIRFSMSHSGDLAIYEPESEMERVASLSWQMLQLYNTWSGARLHPGSGRTGGSPVLFSGPGISCLAYLQFKATGF
jgi:hypothetical protein